MPADSLVLWACFVWRTTLSSHPSSISESQKNSFKQKRGFDLELKYRVHQNGRETSFTWKESPEQGLRLLKSQPYIPPRRKAAHSKILLRFLSALSWYVPKEMWGKSDGDFTKQWYTSLSVYKYILKSFDRADFILYFTDEQVRGVESRLSLELWIRAIFMLIVYTIPKLF